MLAACGSRPAAPSRGRLIGAAAIAALTLVVAGCGGGSTKTATSATTTTSTTVRGGARNQAFNQCMLSHGVDVTGIRGVRGGTTPSSLPAGVTTQQFEAAMTACRSLLPAGGGQNFQNSPAFAAYRNCLQLHGVTLPKAGQGNGGGGQTPGSTTPGAPRGFGGLDTTNPTVQAALKACAALRPAGGPGQGGSTTTPTS